MRSDKNRRARSLYEEVRVIAQTTPAGDRLVTVWVKDRHMQWSMAHEVHRLVYSGLSTVPPTEALLEAVQDAVSSYLWELDSK